MSHKELVRTYIERVWNEADPAALEELTTEGFGYRIGGQPVRDRAGMMQFLEQTHAAFPDWRVQVESLIAENDEVAVRWSGQVTHGGPFHGLPATGRTISLSGINFYRIENGRIAAEFEETDSLGILGQLGLLPQQ